MHKNPNNCMKMTIIMILAMGNLSKRQQCMFGTTRKKSVLMENNDTCPSIIIVMSQCGNMIIPFTYWQQDYIYSTVADFPYSLLI